MKRRVALFDFVTHFGGAQRSVTDILLHLSSTESVRVIDAYGSCREFTETLDARSVPRVVLDPSAARVVIGGSEHRARRWLAVGSALPGLFRLARRLQGAVREFRPDVIFSLSAKSLALLRFTPATRRVPVVMYNGGECDPRVFGPLSRWLLVNVPSATIVLFEGARANMIRMGARAETVHVIPRGTNYERLAAAAERPLDKPLPQSHREARFIVTATLIPGKGQATAIRALGSIVVDGVDGALYLAGDVPRGASRDYLESLRKLARECGVADRVEFLGWRNDVPQILSRCSALLLPTLTDSTPRAIAEAMAVGCPVVASPIGGIPDLIVPGQTGWLCEANDPAAFAAAMRETLNPTARDRVVPSARDHLRERFSVTRQLADVDRALDAVTSGGRAESS